MIRWISGLTVAALILSIGTCDAQAAKKGKKKPTETRVTGVIKAVNDNSTVITISKSAGKGGKDGQAGKKPAKKANGEKKGKKGKNGAVGGKEIRLTQATVIDYVGIENQDERKVQAGYYALATLAGDGTAKTLSVSKSPFSTPKANKNKKKKN